MIPTDLITTLIIASLGMAGWVVAIWQYYRAEEADLEKTHAEVSFSAINRQHHDLIRDLAFPPYGHQARDAHGRFMKALADQQRAGDARMERLRSLQAEGAKR